jgi:hypothetical protein
MAKLPGVMVQENNGYYLRPDSAVGSSAVVYLPAYNAVVRDRYIKKGFVLLSEAEGDFSEKGAAGLRIGPPTDSTIRNMVEALKSRQQAEEDRLQIEIDETQSLLKDNLLDSDDRRLHMQRLRQLKRLKTQVSLDCPSFNEAKSYFYREHRARLAESVPPDFRAGVAAMMQEQSWATMQSKVDEELETEYAAATASE